MNETNIDYCSPAANLVPCLLTTTNHIIDSATALAEHIDTKFTEQKFVGIVWATNGARRIPDVKSARFDDERTYEIRFWQVIGDNNADLTLAHEFRWVNGVGAVELMLTEVTPKASSEGSESGKPCVSGWAHKVSYLQHESTTSNNADSASEPTTGQEEQDQAHTTTKPMTAVEFIREEDKFGNTVVVDQLFTGDWNQS
jgi:hypothetical protein